MKDGFVKVAAGTPRLSVADVSGNAAAIIELIKDAAEQGVKVLTLPELALTGYTNSDLFLQTLLLHAAEEALAQICRETKKADILVAVGLPVVRGASLYNAAAVLYHGEILGVVPKTHIPNYREFYEARHFTSGRGVTGTVALCGREVPFGADLLFRAENLPALTVGVEICEDLWVASPPSITLAEQGATLLLNLSASDEVIGKRAYRRELVKGQSARLLAAYLYAGAGEGESTTDLVFAGHRMIAENGVMLAESEPFGNGLLISEIDLHYLMNERRRINTFPSEQRPPARVVGFSLPLTDTALTRSIDPAPFVPAGENERAERCEMILSMQAHGLTRRITHTGSRTVVLGLSGGLDSTLALIVAVRAMDLLGRSHKDVVAVTMPCFGTTGRTRSNAEKLAEAYGVTLRTVDIAAAVKQHFADIGHTETDYDVVFENGQARERTQVLMDLANQTGGLVVGTGDLSELALGWATYNGDHMSMYGVNASVPKTLIRHMVAYAADSTADKRLSDALFDVLDTPVSPELLPAENGEISQKTEDLVGPYALHDFFLYHFVRCGENPAKIYRLACIAFAGEYAAEEIKRWLSVFFRRFFAQQFKRSCLPDGPKVGSVTLSPRGDWRMPSDAEAKLWLKEIESL